MSTSGFGMSTSNIGHGQLSDIPSGSLESVIAKLYVGGKPACAMEAPMSDGIWRFHWNLVYY